MSLFESLEDPLVPFTLKSRWEHNTKTLVSSCRHCPFFCRFYTTRWV